MARDPDISTRHGIDPGIPPYANPDPINAWRPGSVEEQRASGTHFRPEGSASLGRAKPDREGPDYAAGVMEEEIPTLRITVGIPVRERTLRIIRGPAHRSLLEFVRMQQQYQNTDEALGAQGQFAEIYHDTAKLKRMIWDRRNPQSVTVNEVQETLMSLIGHALLAMDLMDEGNKDGRG